MSLYVVNLELNVFTLACFVSAALRLDPNNESVKENIRVCSVLTFPSASLVTFSMWL